MDVRRGAAVAACLAMLTAAGYAQEPIDDYAEYEVTAARTPSYRLPLKRIGSAITVIERAEIERSGARSLPEILERQAGFVVFDEIGNRSENKVSLRGFKNGDDIVVVVDGMRVNDPNGNFMAWNLIAPETIERIEIVRGGSTSLYGPGALSGVIRIWTRKGRETAGTVRLGAGSHAGRDLAVNWGSSTDRLDGAITAVTRTEKGYRNNSDVTYLDLTSELGVRVGGGRLAVQLQRHEDRLGRAGELNGLELASSRRQSVKPRDYGEFELTRVGVTAEREVLGGLLDLRYSYRERGRASHATFRSGARRFTTDDLLSNAVVAEWSRRMDRHGISLLFDQKHDRTTAVERNPVTNAVTSHRTIRETTRSGAARLDIGLGDYWTLTGTARYDQFEIENRDNTGDTTANGTREFEEWSPGGSLVYHPPILGADGRIFFSASRGFRPPNIFDLYAFPSFGSNRNLRPAKLQTMEAGIFATRGRVSLGATWFNLETEDEIAYDANANLNRNVGRTVREGVEAYLGVQLARYLSFKSDLTWISAHVRENPTDASTVGKRIPQVPVFQASSTLEWDNGKYRAAITHRRVGRRAVDFDDDNNRLFLGSYNVMDLALGWRPCRHATLDVTVKNVFDRQYVTRGIDSFDQFFNPTVFYNPAPGVEVAGALTMAF